MQNSLIKKTAAADKRKSILLLPADENVDFERRVEED